MYLHVPVIHFGSGADTRAATSSIGVGGAATPPAYGHQFKPAPLGLPPPGGFFLGLTAFYLLNPLPRSLKSRPPLMALAASVALRIW